MRAHVFALALAGCASLPASSSELAWQRTAAALPGEWQGDGVDISYRLIAHGSVLLETWMPGTTAESVTAYHLDGEHFMLTHYCSQGNQPRLRLASATKERLVFRRFDATNLSDDAAALAELVLEVQGATLTRTDVYAHGRERERTTIVLTRSD